MKPVPGASLSESSKPADLDQDEMADQAQDHLDTLVKAHGILSNPDHMAPVHALVGRHTAAVKGIKVGKVKDMADLVHRSKSFGSPQEPTEV